MKTYLVISSLHYSILQAETEQKAFIEHVTGAVDIGKVGASKEEIKETLLELGYSKMKFTKINNCFLLS